MNKEIKLKSCPFCNGRATTTPYTNIGNVSGFIVVCRECPCMLKPWHPYQTELEAIEKWNIRF